MPALSIRNTILAAGTAAAALGAGVAGLLLWRRQAGEGHAAPDLALDAPRAGSQERAPAAFRPDPTAVPNAGEREALRPATGHAPGFAADRGTTVQEPAGA